MAESGHNGHSHMLIPEFNRFQPPPGVPQDNREVCKKFMWGICNKYARCKFRHELVFEEMKSVLIFCHNFQNNKTCDRPRCTYLHATQKEESDFTTYGLIPPALAQRYSAMFAAAPPGEQMEWRYLTGLLLPPPPPPPSQPPPPSPRPVAPPVTAPGAPAPPPPPLVASSGPHLPAAAIPPPQPVTVGPPPPPVTSAPHSSFGTSAPAGLASNAVRLAVPPHYATGPPAPVHFQRHYPGPFNGSNGLPPPYPMNHQIPSSSSVLNMPEFDASKPPPPLHTSSKPENCVGAKRKLQTPFEAGASKRAKPSDQSDVCEKCVRRKQRIEEYKKIIDNRMSLEADKNLYYTSHLEEYNRKKMIILGLIPVDKLREIVRFIEGDNVIPDSSNGLNLNNGSDLDYARVPIKTLEDLLQLVASYRNAPVGNASTSVCPGSISSSSDLAPLRISNPSQTVTTENMISMLGTVTDILLGSNQRPRPTLKVRNFADSRTPCNGNVAGSSVVLAAPPMQPLQPHHRPTPRHGPPPVTALPPYPSAAALPSRFMFRHPPPTPNVTQTPSTSNVTHPAPTPNVTQPPPPYFDMEYYRNHK